MLCCRFFTSRISRYYESESEIRTQGRFPADFIEDDHDYVRLLPPKVPSEEQAIEREQLQYLLQGLRQQKKIKDCYIVTPKLLLTISLGLLIVATGVYLIVFMQTQVLVDAIADAQSEAKHDFLTAMTASGEQTCDEKYSFSNISSTCSVKSDDSLQSSMLKSQDYSCYDASMKYCNPNPGFLPNFMFILAFVAFISGAGCIVTPLATCLDAYNYKPLLTTEEITLLAKHRLKPSHGITMIIENIEAIIAKSESSEFTAGVSVDLRHSAEIMRL